ncbi:precorrin-3B synthase [Gordonia terrae]|uniref:Precorrin-3B synthase n=2 Tax=Gordonia terrae TaxID=2055 RepID=A0AAD0NZS3_9ACTN|nr:precorrin-3B synthase [Gordonia terrae]VTR01730.1 ferredoxin-nitrite reductase [Clostridioides difficile]ANY23545.1 precorrin-3B synthase [Gordonia terrae]AWO84279.1 precorrin-3B synthase [Gordonia terrae]VTS52612.1 ferredoxin-nitrite reductase [Gordonia terrae]GAB42324.1 precorrin-3B synthase [Gordonia terrae NBRC 100016]
MNQPARAAADRCPGVFDTHPAADGALARVRLPGGRIRPDQLEELARAAADHADGHLELTVRGNLQLRGITDVEAVAEAVVAAGLAPSSTHDKVRNIELSPLTGRIGGIADARPLAAALDDALRADPAAASLSGRFLFGIDDGRGDIAARRPDACAVIRARTPLAANISIGGVAVGSASGSEAIVRALIAVAAGLGQVVPGAWRVRDLDTDARRRLTDLVASGLDPVIDNDPDTTPSAPGEPIVGWFDQDDGAVLLGAVVELGRLPARLAEFIAAVQAPIVFTPDREILLCDLGEGVAETVVRVLAPMGLIFDAASPWASVSCCVGAPGCASAHAPVRDDLMARVQAGDPVDEREHWVGCARGCGSPAESHLSVEATPDGGYERRRR